MVVVVGVFEPLLQQGFELAHVLEGEVQGLEAGDGGLREVVAVQLAHGQAYVPLKQNTVSYVLNQPGTVFGL